MSTTASVGVAAPWGQLVIGTDIDDFTISTLRRWMPTYLNHFRQDRGLSFMPAVPRTYTNTFAAQEFLDHQIPAIVVTTTTLTAARGGKNMAYEGTWHMEVACILRGKRPTATRFLSALYEGVVRECIVQQNKGGPIQDINPVNMRYEQVADVTGAGRYLLASVSTFNVYSDKIVEPAVGPDIPDADVYLNEATIVEVDVDVSGIPIGGQF